MVIQAAVGVGVNPIGMLETIEKAEVLIRDRKALADVVCGLDRTSMVPITLATTVRT